MPILEDAVSLQPFLSLVPDLEGIDALYEVVLQENSHAVRGELRVLRAEVFATPYEDGTNVGEIELELNLEGNHAIYGVYTIKPHFQCFMN
jgi:hypothetical protein